MKKFAEVKYDYKEPETGNIAIDTYLNGDGSDDDGRTVAWVTPNGEVVKCTGELCEENDLKDVLVKEALQTVKNQQLDRKQKITDEAIEEIKRDIAKGDVTAIEGLLLAAGVQVVLAYLPEEKWKNFD